ncbi:hypothetical protein N0V90_000619 [Kalmusia sp. IMI 367209]|nr:hypothetical protein N0V90_000619 [Kalmusia sp. IMI 367209]
MVDISRFELDTFFDLRIDDKIILPIISKSVIKEGPDSSIYNIEIHPEYNLLVSKSEDGHPIRNNFALKTYKARNIEAHNMEVDAYRVLSDQIDIQPYLVHFYGSWAQGGLYNMLFEFVGGGTLTQFMEKTSPPTQGEDFLNFWRSLLNIIKPLTRIHSLPLTDDGNQYLQGIHHDIKPDNVLVTSRKGPCEFEVTFKLADLGLTEFEPATNRGAPEYFVNENDLFLLRTAMEAKPSKDIWSLGCVFSEAAVWSVLGYDGLLQYKKARTAATEAFPELRNTAYSGCFHNGLETLRVIQQTHAQICTKRHRNDSIIESMVELVDAMLVAENRRPSAVDVYRRSRRILTMASDFLGTNDRFMGSAASRFEQRQTPPEQPPDLRHHFSNGRAESPLSFEADRGDESLPLWVVL